MRLKPETLGFIRAGMLFVEPPRLWRHWQRNIWSCCGRNVDELEAWRELEDSRTKPRTHLGIIASTLNGKD